MKAALRLHLAVVLLLLYLPIVVMAAFSFNAAEQVVVWKGFTTEWYRRALSNPEVRAAFGHSLSIGLGATLLASILGTAAAFAAVRWSIPGKRCFLALAALPLAVPDVLMGLSLAVFFLGAGLELGRGTVVAAHATFCLAYVAVVVGSRLKAFDPNLELAARDLGATPVGAFFKVTLPAIAPALAGGAVLAFAVSFDDVVVTHFTSGPRVETLPVYLYSKVRFRYTPEVNALSTLVLAVSALLTAGALALHRPSIEGGSR